MAFVLLVSADSKKGTAMRETLIAQGWWVSLVFDREGALRAAADHEPDLVVVDQRVGGAAELVKIFSSRNGGPGAVGLGSPEGDIESFALVEAGADEMLSIDPRTEELIRTVQRVAAIPHRSNSPAVLPGRRRLTADEIFGDILSEIEAEASEEDSAPTGPFIQSDLTSDSAPLAIEAPPVPNVSESTDETAVEKEEEAGAEYPASATPVASPAEEPAEEAAGADSDDGGPEALEAPDMSGAESPVEPVPIPAPEENIEWNLATEEASASTRIAAEVAEVGKQNLEEDLFPSAERAEVDQLLAVPSSERPDGQAAPEPAFSEPLAAMEAGVEADVAAEPREAPGANADSEAELEQASAPKTAFEALSESEVAPDAATERMQTRTETPSLRGAEGGQLDTDFGQYRLEERIAVGGMAEVWRASMMGMEGFRKTVAIKKILPHLAENDEFVAMFVDEAKLAAQLNHENLVDIYDLGKIGDDFFIAMEYVDGKDLRSILNRLNRRVAAFPLGFACFIAARTAAALDYAHSHRDEDGEPLDLVHRDVSPRNILISHNGNIRLCDFGVAKAVSSVAQTEIGALKGKIQYMSPEQAQGRRVDGRSDVFSLGSVLFEMVTGRRLFVEDSEVSLLDAVRSGDVEEPRSINPDLPEEINGIILRSLGKEPEDRYANAGELLMELEQALFRLEPAPTPGALAEWMQGIFLDEPSAGAPRATEQAWSSASASFTPPSAPPEPAVSETPPSEPPLVEEEEPARPGGELEEFSAVGATGQPDSEAEGLRRFWIGIIAGLILALLIAFALDRWLWRSAEPADAAPVVEEPLALPPVGRADEPAEASAERGEPIASDPAEVDGE